MKKYNKIINYNNKWILYKEFCSDRFYMSIFIIDIKDGIVKYISEGNIEKNKYESESFFENCDEFFINPIQMNNPFHSIKGDCKQECYNNDNLQMNHEEYKSEYIDSSDSYFIEKNKDKKFSNGSVCCDHEWIFSLLPTYPPKYQRECRKCGMVQQKSVSINDWKIIN